MLCRINAKEFVGMKTIENFDFNLCTHPVINVGELDLDLEFGKYNYFKTLFGIECCYFMIDISRFIAKEEG